MANTRYSTNQNTSASQAPSSNANEWVEVQRRFQWAAPASSQPLDIQNPGQFVQQLGPDEPWDGIAMLHASQNAANYWHNQGQYQSQDQSYDERSYAGQQQQDHAGPHNSTQAEHGSRRSERRRDASGHDESRREGKSKKASKSKSSRK